MGMGCYADCIAFVTLPRVYAIADTGSLERRGFDVLLFTTELLEAGVRLLQYRHKGGWGRGEVQQLEAVAKLCRQYDCRLIVNDRADLAAVLGAGVHVGQDDLPPALARRVVGEGAWVGFSTHNAEQLVSAEGEAADYLALGPVFGTASKTNPDPVVGLDGVVRLRGLTGKPLVAIGGITRQTARPVWDAGADSVAVIADLIPEEGRPGAARARMKEWLELAR